MAKPPIEYRPKRHVQKSRARASSDGGLPVRDASDKETTASSDGMAFEAVVRPTGRLGRRVGGKKEQGEFPVTGNSDLAPGHSNQAVGRDTEEIIAALKEFVTAGQNASQAARDAVDAYKATERAKVLARVNRHRAKKKAIAP